MHIGKRLLIVPLLYLPLTYTIVALVGRGFCLPLALSEAGAVEVVGAVGLLLGSALMLIAFFRYPKTRGHETSMSVKRLSYLVLALILFYAAGEESSWGQFILHIDTPAIIGSINRQNEITLHNLMIPIAGGRAIDASAWASRLANMFWLLWAVVLPSASTLYEPLRRRLKNLTPVIPWSLGMLFAANYALFRVSLLIFSAGRHTGLNELKESNFGVLFALAAAYLLADLTKPESATGDSTRET